MTPSPAPCSRVRGVAGLQDRTSPRGRRQRHQAVLSPILFSPSPLRTPLGRGDGVAGSGGARAGAGEPGRCIGTGRVDALQGAVGATRGGLGDAQGGERGALRALQRERHRPVVGEPSSQGRGATAVDAHLRRQRVPAVIGPSTTSAIPPGETAPPGAGSSTQRLNPPLAPRFASVWPARSTSPVPTLATSTYSPPASGASASASASVSTGWARGGSAATSSQAPNGARRQARSSVASRTLTARPGHRPAQAQRRRAGSGRGPARSEARAGRHLPRSWATPGAAGAAPQAGSPGPA